MENVDDVLVHRGEFEYPPWEKFLEKKYLLPVVCYFLVWRVLARFVSTHLWKEYQGFRQYRLRNLSICFLHSLLTGSAALIFSFVNTKVMLEDPLHWWDDSCAHVFLLSIGYFVHDALDMLSHEWSKWMLELLFHHLITIFVFAVQLSVQKFQPYAFWALLMEVSSVFLHSRSLLQLSGVSERNPRLFRGFLWMNLFAFIAFRFCVQTWQIWWIDLFNDQRFSFLSGFKFGWVFGRETPKRLTKQRQSNFRKRYRQFGKKETVIDFDAKIPLNLISIPVFQYFLMLCIIFGLIKMKTNDLKQLNCA